MKERYTCADLKRCFGAIYCLPANYTMIRYVIGDGAGYCTRTEGWACDVYPVGRVALTWGDAPKGTPLPQTFCRIWERRGRRVYDSDATGRLARQRRLRAAFFRAVNREFGIGV